MLDAEKVYNDIKSFGGMTLLVVSGLLFSIIYLTGKSASNISKNTKLKANVNLNK